MKSLVLHGFNDLRIEEVPYPELRPGWVILKMRVVQPSITEVLLAKGLPTPALDHVKKILEKGPTPLLGHELCGEVVEVGGGVERLRRGDRVTSLGSVPCGECRFCRRGRRDMCRSGVSISHGIPGSRFAEYAALPEDALAKVPDGVSDYEAAAIQPLSSCVAVVKPAIRMGDTVAVIGQGSMGLTTMQVSRVSGAKLVVATDIREESVQISRELGADLVVNASTEDPVKRIMEITDNEGVDVVFETSGGSPKLGLSGSTGLMQAIRMAKPSGRIVPVALYASLTVDFTDVGWRNLILPAGENLEILEHAISLVSSGRVKLKPLITHILKGLEKVPEAFEITGNKSKYRAINPAQVEI